VSRIDQKQIIQQIVDAAVSVAEPGWLEIIAETHIDDMQSDLLSSFLTWEEGKKVEKWLPVPNNFFLLVRELRDHLASGGGREPFSSCKLHLWADGRFDVAYGYGPVDWKALMLRGSNYA
jgi:hypothetical protein